MYLLTMLIIIEKIKIVLEIVLLVIIVVIFMVPLCLKVNLLTPKASNDPLHPKVSFPHLGEMKYG